jgi:hypothetical protein
MKQVWQLTYPVLSEELEGLIQGSGVELGRSIHISTGRKAQSPTETEAELMICKPFR